MGGEGGFQVIVRRGLGELRQRLADTVLCVVDVLQFVEKQIIEGFHVYGIEGCV
jgi:hypothetical protein